MGISADTALAIAAGIVGYAALYPLITALLGAAFGVGITRIQIGLFPSIRLFHIGQTEFRIAPLLLGSHVKFAAKDDDTPYAPWPVRVIISLIPPLIVIALCAIPLGTRAVDEALLAWPQMWAVATDFATPVNIDAALAPALQSGALLAAAAIVVIKAAMFNLLPIPVFNGGMFLLALAEGVTRRDIHSRLPQWLLVLSLFLPLAFVIFLVSRIVMGN